MGQKHISSHMGYLPPPLHSLPMCQNLYHHGKYGWTLTLTYILTMNYYNNNSDNISENLECLIFSKALSTYVITTLNPTKSKHKKVQTNAFLFWQIHTGCTFWGKSPLSSYRMTLKQWINGEKWWKMRDKTYLDLGKFLLLVQSTEQVTKTKPKQDKLLFFPLIFHSF